MEIGNGAVSTTYLRSLNIDEPFIRNSDDSEYYHIDALGSTVRLTNQPGEIIASYRYGAYGKAIISGTSKNLFQYTGREADDKELYFYRARYYSPLFSRFISEDPLNFSFRGFSLYTYVEGKPLDWIDPFGWEKQKPWWEKFGEGYYYGTNYGKYATAWYAKKWDETGQWYYALGGIWAALWTPETYQDTAWTLIGATAYTTGFEIFIGKNFRIAPFGNRTGHPTGELPHYHRRIVGPDGKTVPGGGIKWHRPWEGGF